MQNSKLDLNQAPLMTVDDVATYLRMTPAWVRQHSHGTCNPSIPSIKIGKYRRFRMKFVEEFLRELERGMAAIG